MRGQHAELLLAAQLLQLIDPAAAVVLVNERDALGPQPLDLEQLQRAGGELLQQLIAPLAGAAREDLADGPGQTFADAGDLRDLAGGIPQHILHAFGVAFNGAGAVAVTADAEGVLAGDFHEIGRLPEHARYLFVFHS